MLPTPPIQLKRSVEWLNVVLGGAVEATYEGTKSPGGNLDEVWHEVTTTGDWIIPAEEQHLSAQRSEQLNVYYGTTPHRWVEIMKCGRVENSSVHASTSRTPWCLVGCSTLDAAFEGWVALCD